MAKKESKPSVNTFTQNVMGFNVSVEAPAGLPALIDWVGGEAIAYKMCLKYALYHGFSPKLRAAFADKLEEMFPEMPRRQAQDAQGNLLTRIVKDEDGNKVEEPILETEKEYWDYLFSEGVITHIEGQRVIQELASSIDAKPKAVSSRKPAKKVLEAAVTIMNAIKSGTKTEDDFIAAFEANNSVSFASLGEFSLETVAKALQINKERLDRESLALGM